MKKNLLLCVSLLALSAVSASASPVKEYVGTYDATTHAISYHYVTDLDRTMAARNAMVYHNAPSIDTGYCTMRAPKTKTRGSASLLFCYGDPDVAYDFYINNSGHSSGDPDSTTYLKDSTGAVLYAR